MELKLIPYIQDNRDFSLLSAIILSPIYLVDWRRFHRQFCQVNRRQIFVRNTRLNWERNVSQVYMTREKSPIYRDGNPSHVNWINRQENSCQAYTIIDKNILAIVYLIDEDFLVLLVYHNWQGNHGKFGNYWKRGLQN